MKNRKSLKINVILNCIKQLCSVIIPLITVPYISRTLQAENYGKYCFSNSIIGYITLLAGLGIQTYAIREGARIREDREEISAFASEVFTINIITTIAAYSCLIILLFVPKLQSYRELILVQSIVILFTTVGTDWINTIYEDYGYLTIRYIIVQLLSIAAMLILVRKPDDYVLYAGIVSVSSAGANILNIVHVRKYVHLKVVQKPHIEKHLPPILILFANQLAVTVYVNSDITLLGLLADDKAVGIYSVSSKIYAIIKQLVNAIVIVAVPRLSAFLGVQDESRYLNTCSRILNGLVTMLLPAIVGLFMISQYIVRLIGGLAYEEGSIALRILSFSLFFATLACFFSNCILIPLKKEKAMLLSTIAGAITNVLLNFVFIPGWGINGTAITTVIGEAVVFIGVYMKSCRMYKIGVSKGCLISSCVGCIAIIAVCKAVPQITGNWITILSLDVFLSVVAYSVCLLVFKNDLLMELMKGKMGRK